jgi:hypothetical protein
METYISPQKYSAELSVLGLSERLRVQALAVKKAALRPVALKMLARARESNMIPCAWPWYAQCFTREERHSARRKAWQQRAGLRLAALAGYKPDEHGFSTRGDHWTITVVEFVPPYMSAAAPYLDQGGDGMALIRIDRRRVYAKSSKWFPSTTASHYVVGRNEAGTYYGHPVQPAASLAEALAWMWQGYTITERQGDIALVAGGKSGYIPALPDGHRLTATGIEHDTHAMLRLPGKGERIIVAKRAEPRVSHATRD